MDKLKKTEIEETIKDLKEDEAVAFTDGCFKYVDGHEITTTGIVFVIKGSTCELKERGRDKETLISSAHFMAKVRAARRAMYWAIKEEKKKLVIYSNNLTIVNIINQKNKAGSPITTLLKEACDYAMNYMDIEPRHVSEKDGVPEFIRALELAREAINDENVPVDAIGYNAEIGDILQ